MDSLDTVAPTRYRCGHAAPGRSKPNRDCKKCMWDDCFAAETQALQDHEGEMTRLSWRLVFYRDMDPNDAGKGLPFAVVSILTSCAIAFDRPGDPPRPQTSETQSVWTAGQEVEKICNEMDELQNFVDAKIEEAWSRYNLLYGARYGVEPSTHLKRRGLATPDP